MDKGGWRWSRKEEIKSAERMTEEDSKGGRRSLGGGTVGLSFSSSVWIRVLLLGTGARLAYPGWRNLKYRENISGRHKHSALSYPLYVCGAGTGPGGSLGWLHAYLPPSGVPGRRLWEPRSRTQTTRRGSAPGRGRRSRA